MPVYEFLPFHEAIVKSINSCSAKDLPSLATIIKITKIPKDWDLIISAWEEKVKKLGRSESKDFKLVVESLKFQKDESLRKLGQSKELIQSVDYSVPLDSIIASGNWIWKDKGVGAKSQVFDWPAEVERKEVPVSARIFISRSSVFYPDVVAEMADAGFRPATLFEVLSFEGRIDIPHKAIMALGVVWTNSRLSSNVAVGIMSTFNGRFINLYLLSDGFSEGTHFLGIQK